MDSQSESDLSERMRNLIECGYAVKRGKEHLVPEARYPGEPRVPVRDSDVPNVQRPLTLNMSAGIASTHGLAAVARDIVPGGNRNTGTTEVGFKAVGETRSTTQGGDQEARSTQTLKRGNAIGL